MPIQFTRKGRYEVWRDGQKISEHNQEREATEQIINHSSVYGDGDYEIKGYLVVARVVGSVNPQTGDATPPTTPGSVSASATSATTGTVTWTASTDANGVAGYQIFLDGAPLNPTTTNLSYSLTGLSPSTQYAVTVVAFDAAGNNSVAGGPALFTTNANSAPVWSLGNQAYETGASVSISLDTVCTDADGDTITYSLVSGSLPSGLSLSGVRNETLSGTVDTVETAVFTLGASDGIASVQNVALTFTITAPDTVAPAAPTGLALSGITSTSINLNWNDNAESDLASYTVYRSTDGVNFGVRQSGVLVSNYSDSGLNSSTTYYYNVTATDNSGNQSSASSTASDTTLALNTPYDLTAGGTRTVPITYSWPTDAAPTINAGTVTSIAALNAAIAANTEVTLQPGTYSGNISVGAADDNCIINLTGCTINGAPDFQGSQIRVNGGRINHSGNEVFMVGSDILFYNTYFNCTGTGQGAQLSPASSAQRIAFVYCTIRDQNVARGMYAFSGTGQFIFAACDIDIAYQGGSGTPPYGPWGIRVMTANNTIFADCRWSNIVTVGANLRFHAKDANVDGLWFVGNSVETSARIEVNPFGEDGSTFGDITNVYMDSNNFYNISSSSADVWFHQSGYGSVSTGRFQGNRLYTNAVSAGSTFLPAVNNTSGFTYSDNLTVAYSAPSAFTGGSDQ